MKKIIIIFILAILTIIAGTATASNYQDEYLGLPGDNLNLYATMKLFQESETLEGFERSLNDKNSQINNLDLNGDKLVDYISVMDYVDENVHTIVLRTELNSYETQDIAVFTVQRFNDGSARIQLIGDETLYGKNYIVEPIYADSQETPNPGYMGNTAVITTPRPVTVTTYQVATWPIIRFIFRPGYTCWHSSWSWGYYPSYWNPWRPYYWHTYYGYHSHYSHFYHSHYRYWNHHRYHRYHDFYYGRVRSYSSNVNHRIREGNYRTTYSRPDLRTKGDDLYKRTARRSTELRTNNSNNGRTNSSQSVIGRSGYNSNSNSGRRAVSANPSRTRTSSQVNREVVNTRKSSTIKSTKSASTRDQGSNNMVSQRAGNKSTSSSYRTGTSSSVNTNRGVQQKSKAVINSRSPGSSSAKQNYRQPARSSSAYSNKSTIKPKVSSRSSNSVGSYRQATRSSAAYSNRSATKPKVSSRSSNSGSSYRQPMRSSSSYSNKSASKPKVSSRSSSSRSSSRQPTVSSSSRSKSSKATINRSSQSRSSSSGRSSRR